MNLDSIGSKLDAFLYRKSLQKLTPEDIASARAWCHDVIRKNHPQWNDDQVEKYYESLVNVRVLVVDEWERRNR